MKTRSKTNNMVKLPKKLKDRWVKALRSGEYKQSEEVLYYSDSDEEGFCCLGLACKLQGVDTDNMYMCGYPQHLDVEDQNKLHPFFHQKIENGVEENSILGKLAGFNDSGKSFKWIASYIERYL